MATFTEQTKWHETAVFCRACKLLHPLPVPPQSTFLLLMVLGSTVATPWVSLVQPPKRAEPKKPNFDLCPVCVQFAGEFINELLNIILSEETPLHAAMGREAVS